MPRVIGYLRHYRHYPAGARSGRVWPGTSGEPSAARHYASLVNDGLVSSIVNRAIIFHFADADHIREQVVEAHTPALFADAQVLCNEYRQVVAGRRIDGVDRGLMREE
jgi:hypothetical protein